MKGWLLLILALPLLALAALLVTGATSALALGPLDAEAELPVYSKNMG